MGQPSSRPIGRLIRGFLSGDGTPPHASMALLFAADRLHLETEIERLVAAGTIVLCDRHVLSSLAYQTMFLPHHWVEEINVYAKLPDLTLFVDVDPTTATSRVAARKGRREIYETDEQTAKTVRKYRELATILKRSHNIHTVDGSGTREQTHGLVIEAVERLLNQ